MIEIRKLEMFTQEQLKSLGYNGYTTNKIYKITKNEKTNEIHFRLKLIPLKTPFFKTYPVNSESFDKYKNIIAEGFSFGAYAEDKITGVVIAENWKWNNTLNIEYIEVAEEYRCKGIGTMLLKHLEVYIKKNSFRMIGLETQNTNVGAIDFYRKNGFEITGINLSLYDKAICGDEAAIYMSKKLSS